MRHATFVLFIGLCLMSAFGLQSCGSSNGQSVTLESLAETVSQLQERIEALEQKVPSDLATSLQGTWTAFEFDMTSGSSGSQAQIVIDASSNFTMTVSVGGPLKALPCTSGSLTSGSANFNAQQTITYNCGGAGTGNLFVLDNRAGGLLLLDIDDDVVLRLIGATS